jgi:glutamyl-Q tRNA(Asp) synthetase
LNASKAIAIAGLPNWKEGDGRTFTASAADIDDEILARKDAPAAYHLACVVDDAASGVDLVVRGADLRPSSPVQRLLQMLLGLPEPRYLHHPLVVTEDGRRLAKRDEAPTLALLRSTGVNGEELAAELATGRMPAGFRLDEA